MNYPRAVTDASASSLNRRLGVFCMQPPHRQIFRAPGVSISAHIAPLVKAYADVLTITILLPFIIFYRRNAAFDAAEEHAAWQRADTKVLVASTNRRNMLRVGTCV